MKPREGQRMYVVLPAPPGYKRVLVKEADERGRWHTVVWKTRATNTRLRRFRRYCDRKYGRIG